jgi:hypothetical protein
MCGEKTAALVFCRACGQQTDTETGACRQCGAVIEAYQITRGGAIPDRDPAATVPGAIFGEGADIPPGAPRRVKRGLKLKLIIPIAAAVAVVGALAALFLTGIVKLPGGGGTSGRSDIQAIVYLKDNQLVFSPLGKPKPFDLTEKLNKDTDYTEDDMTDFMYYVAISDSGNRIIYPDQIKDGDSGCKLFFRNPNKAKDTATQIDSDIREYYVNPELTRMVYSKGDKDKLYLYDFKEKATQISGKSDDVYHIYVNEAVTTVVYSNGDNDLTVLTGKALDKTAQTIKKTDRGFLEHYSEDLSEIWYLKNEKLYYYKVGQEKPAEIDKNVIGVVAKYESGAIYYAKAGGEDVNLYTAFVNDDKKAADASLTEPDESDFNAYEDYWNAFYEYEDKLYRDELREELKRSTFTAPVYQLYYREKPDKESVLLSENYANSSYYDHSATDSPVLFFNESGGEYEKIKLSELYSVYDAETFASGQSVTGEGALAVGAAVLRDFDEENANYRVNAAGTVIYYLANYDYEEGLGELTKQTISAAGLGKAVLIEDEVSGYYIIGDGAAVYYYKDDTLYVDGIEAGDDVYGLRTIRGSGALAFIQDWDDEDESGDLYYFDGKEAVLVAEEVHNYIAYGENKIAYITEWKAAKGRGELFLYTGKKEPAAVDEDVTGIVPVVQGGYRIIPLTY